MVDKIRIVGISTSPRKGANTERMVKYALTAAEEVIKNLGCSPEIIAISLAKKRILPCIHCNKCIEKGSICVLKDDWAGLIQEIIKPIPNGLILGSPVYYFNQNSIGRAFLERCSSLFKKYWVPTFPLDPPDFSKTSAGAIAVGSDRMGGEEHTISTIIHTLLTMDFLIVGGFYIGGAGWTLEKAGLDAIEGDRLGIESARLVGKKVAKTAVLLKIGAANISQAIPFFSRMDMKYK